MQLHIAPIRPWRASFLSLYRSHCSEVILCSDFMEPCYQGYVLAPTKAQRLRYARWLRTHAQKEVTMSRRQKAIWEEYMVCSDSSLIVLGLRNEGNVKRGLDRTPTRTAPRIVRDGSSGMYDPFEPNDIATALRKPCNLGHLIFHGTGDFWRNVCLYYNLPFCDPYYTIDAQHDAEFLSAVFPPVHGVSSVSTSPNAISSADPLTAVFRKLGMNADVYSLLHQLMILCIRHAQTPNTSPRREILLFI